MSRIDTVTSRARLRMRREPYWHRVSAGVFVGFRKGQDSGTWVVRTRDEATGAQKYKSLGDLGTVPDGERFDRAFREAQAHAAHLAAGGVATPKTVADACGEYVKHLRTTRDAKAATDAEKRFASYVTNEARFATTELTKLTPATIGAWRMRLAERPVHRGSRGSKPSIATDKRRTASSLNRDMTPFRAALNHAFEQGWVTSDFAWRAKLKPTPNADRQRSGGYLTRNERRRLLEAAERGGTGVDRLVRVLCGLPVRPGALCHLKVKHFNPALKELSITLDKTGERKIVLPDGIAGIFELACRSKLPEAFIFTRHDGKPWNKDAWKDPFRAAAKAAGLSEAIVMYSLRHATLSDLVAAGTDLMTISRLSGTSVKMLQDHYAHLIPSVATAAIAAVAI